MKKFLLTLLCAAGLATASNAAVSELYTVQFGPKYNSEGVSAYNKSWSVTCDGTQWNIANFNNNNNGWEFIKCGSTKGDYVGTITSDAALPEKISSVVVTIGSVKTDYLNSIKLSVADNSAFTNAVVVEAPKADIKAGDLKFTVAAPAADMYYKLSFDCKTSQKNGVVQVNKVVFSGEAGE